MDLIRTMALLMEEHPHVIAPEMKADGYTPE
jgi:hypothetical protein